MTSYDVLVNGMIHSFEGRTWRTLDHANYNDNTFTPIKGQNIMGTFIVFHYSLCLCHFQYIKREMAHGTCAVAIPLSNRIFMFN